IGGPAEARVFAQQFGYPLLLKAVAGGGGKGMRRVDSDADLDSAFRDAASEAERSFSNPDLYVEKLIERPRHIEIQLLGDRYGHMVHFGERECSIQRRHQKGMEECPSPLVAARPGMREAMGEAAIRVAQSAGYYNAGTVEFLVDARGDFYFLEMNTRLQVEHPITELVTGHDLVRLQMEVAAGEKLRLRQKDIAWRGSAIECRIYAEDPYNNFFPSPGKITRLTRPLGPGVRLDGCVYDGWTVPIDYDPLLAKLAVWSGTRESAIARMLRALREYDVAGIHTNITFFRQILEDEEFREGLAHALCGRISGAPQALCAAAGSGIHRGIGGRLPFHAQHRAYGKRAGAAQPLARDRPPRGAAMKVSLAIDGQAREIDPDRSGAQIAAVEPGVYSVLMDGRSYEARIEQSDGCVIVFIDGHRFEVEIRDPRRWSRQSGRQGVEGRLNVVAPM